jgi:hypothetical protein
MFSSEINPGPQAHNRIGTLAEQLARAMCPADVRRSKTGRLLARLLREHAEELVPVLAELLAEDFGRMIEEVLHHER